MSAGPSWTYPALIAVLGQDRRPSLSELRNLVVRIRREVTPHGASPVAGRRAVRRFIVAALKPPAGRRFA